MIPIAIIEDHPLYRRSVAQVVSSAHDMSVVAAAASVEEFEALDAPAPDVTLLDLELPGVQGAEAVARLVRDGCYVLVLSFRESPQDVIEAIRAGARGYLTKYVDEPELLAAIRVIAGGSTYVSATLATYLLQAQIKLSARQREILDLLADGDTDQDIADKIGRSVHTVRTQLDRIREKTGLSRRVQLAGYWREQGGGTSRRRKRG